MPSYFNTLTPEDTESLAWRFLLTAITSIRNGSTKPVYLSVDKQTSEVVCQLSQDANTCLWQEHEGVWCHSSQIPSIASTLFDLYLPLIQPLVKEHFAIAHLGQSVDSQIATSSGDGFFVTGDENRRHLHCLRALSDAVIVGANTIITDNPQLTTRAVEGENPVRVVLDPRAELELNYGVFTDGQARTILMHQSSANIEGLALHDGPVLTSGLSQVERWVVPDSDTVMTAQQIVSLLVEGGLSRLYVEGGGVTVSRFFDAAVLDRLHIAIAPLLVGKGTPALQLAGVEKMVSAHRPPCAIYGMGDDVLWDFNLTAVQNHTTSEHSDSGKLCSPTIRMR